MYGRHLPSIMFDSNMESGCISKVMITLCKFARPFRFGMLIARQIEAWICQNCIRRNSIFLVDWMSLRTIASILFILGCHPYQIRGIDNEIQINVTTGLVAAPVWDDRNVTILVPGPVEKWLFNRYIIAELDDLVQWRKNSSSFLTFDVETGADWTLLKLKNVNRSYSGIYQTDNFRLVDQVNLTVHSKTEFSRKCPARWSWLI